MSIMSELCPYRDRALVNWLEFADRGVPEDKVEGGDSELFTAIYGRREGPHVQDYRCNRYAKGSQ